MEWLYNCIQWILSDWKTVLLGGLIVVSVVIFLMGVLKKILFDKVKNKMLRKTLLSFSSIILVAPATAVWIVSKGWSWDWNVFWTLYAVNSVATVLIYWFYEGTHVRELLSLIGKNTIAKWFKVFSSGEAITSVSEEVEQDAVEVIKTSKYRDEDLKKL